jgi:NAD(P)-dependent dehydrogenase (short-subunit alcohol dehydrogenase family)
MGLLEGNVTLITGGGSGLGRAIVDRFVREGAKVGVLELSPEKAAALEADFGDDVVVTVGSVTTGEGNRAAVDATTERFGKLDTFIGNAGVWDFGAALDDTTLDAFEAAFDELYSVNVKGYLLGAKASLEALRASGGSMIFTLSNAAFHAGGGGPLYVSSKHAVVGLIAQLAWELEDEIRVNGVAPGGMSTDLRGLGVLGQEQSFGALIESIGGDDAFAQMIGKKFFPTPEDYVMGYVLLASNESRATNGTVLQMHGMLGPPPKPAH